MIDIYFVRYINRLFEDTPNSFHWVKNAQGQVTGWHTTNKAIDEQIQWELEASKWDSIN